MTEEDGETAAPASTAPAVSPRVVVEKDEEGLTKLHKLVHALLHYLCNSIEQSQQSEQFTAELSIYKV